jgi:hypothetical protein
MEAKGAFFIWRGDSVGLPQGLEKIRNTIDIYLASTKEI